MFSWAQNSTPISIQGYLQSIPEEKASSVFLQGGPMGALMGGMAYSGGSWGDDWLGTISAFR